MGERGKAGRHAKGILVHCRKGMSRSVAAVMAYLVWAENRNVIRIWEDIILARKVAWPNAEFWTQLCMWRMWDCKLSDRDGNSNMYYDEYVLEKGLSSALLNADIKIWHRLGLEPPDKYWEINAGAGRKAERVLYR